MYVGAFKPQVFWHKEGPLTGIDCSWQERKETVLWTGEIIFNTIFLAEMMIKIIARGFLLHKHAYLRDALNWLDFVVVVSGTISVIMDMVSIPTSSMTQVGIQIRNTTVLTCTIMQVVNKYTCNWREICSRMRQCNG